MHFLIGCRQSFQFVRPESIDFQLERQSRFQVPVDAIFMELITCAVCEEFRMLAPEEDHKSDAADAPFDEDGAFGDAESGKSVAEHVIVHNVIVTDGNVQDVNGLFDQLEFGFFHETLPEGVGERSRERNRLSQQSAVRLVIRTASIGRSRRRRSGIFEYLHDLHEVVLEIVEAGESGHAAGALTVLQVRGQVDEVGHLVEARDVRHCQVAAGFVVRNAVRVRRWQ